MPIGRCLILNCDYSLIHVTPSWTKTLRLVVREKIRPLSFYPTPARGTNWSIDVPSVAVLHRHVSLKARRQTFNQPTKRNLLFRDGFACAYCGRKLSLGTITRDHVHPTSRGGRDTLLNVVSACSPCNARKDDRTPAEAGMPLLIQPRALTEQEKIEVMVKTHKAFERQAWLAALNEHQIQLF